MKTVVLFLFIFLSSISLRAQEYAKVKMGKLWGYLDDKGKEILAPKYHWIGKLANGVVNCKLNKQFGLDVDGEFIVVEDAIKINDFIAGEELALARSKNDKFGYINRKGEWVLKPIYTIARNFAQGLALVFMKGEAWSFINIEGDFKIKGKFRDAIPFAEGNLAPIKYKTSWGFVDLDGKLILEDQYGLAKPKGFHDGIARVKFKGKMGYINTKGEFLQDEIYDFVGEFKNIQE